MLDRILYLEQSITDRSKSIILWAGMKISTYTMIPLLQNRAGLNWGGAALWIWQLGNFPNRKKKKKEKKKKEIFFLEWSWLVLSAAAKQRTRRKEKTTMTGKYNEKRWAATCHYSRQEKSIVVSQNSRLHLQIACFVPLKAPTPRAIQFKWIWNRKDNTFAHQRWGERWMTEGCW